MITQSELAEMETHIPDTEVFLLEWCRLHTLHLLAYELGQYRLAAKLADRKYEMWCADRSLQHTLDL